MVGARGARTPGLLLVVLLLPLTAGGVGAGPLPGDLPATEALFYLATAPVGTELIPGIYVDVGGPCPGCRPGRWAVDADRPVHGAQRIVASPDGMAVAILQDNALTVRGLNGSELGGTSGIGLPRTIRWAPDGSFLVTASGEGHGLRRFSPQEGVSFPAFGSFIDAWILPNGTLVGVREAGGSYLFPGNHLLHPGQIPGDLVAPDGTSFLRLDAEGRMVEERIADRSTRTVLALGGHTPLAWDGTWVLVRHSGALGEARWNLLRTSDGFPMVPGGLAGTPQRWSFHPDGGAIAVVVDHGDGTSRIEVRQYASDWTGFAIPYAAVPFVDLTWARVREPVRVWTGEQPPLAPPPTAGPGRFAFVRFEDDRVEVASVRPEGTDLRVAWTGSWAEHGGVQVLGGGTAPGRIAFRAAGSVWEVPWTGGEPVELVPRRGEGLVFSPDGQRMAVVVDDEDDGILLYRRNGTGWKLERFVDDGWDPVFLSPTLLSYELRGMRVVADLATGSVFPLGPPGVRTLLVPEAAFFLHEHGDRLFRVSYGANPGVGRRELLLESARPLASARGYVVAAAAGAVSHGHGLVLAPDGTIRTITDLAYLLTAAFSMDGSGFVALELVDEGGTWRYRIRFHPLGGGPPVTWPLEHTFSFVAFPVALPALLSGPDAEALAHIAASALPTYAVGEGTAGFVSGKVLYKSRFGKGSYIVVRDGAGAPVPVQRVGEAVVWDTSQSPNGYYTVEATDESGGVLETASYLVQNPRSTGGRIGAAAAAGLAITITTSWLAGLSAAAKESAIELAESKLASGAARGAIGFAGKGAVVTGAGLVGAGALLGVAGAYEQSVDVAFDPALFAALLPYVGAALTLLFLAEMAMDRFYARHLGHEAEFRLWVPGAISLAASTLLFANPFGMPGHVSGVEGADREVGGRRGLANFLVLFALLLPFVAVARWRFEVYEVGVTAALMLAVNISLPLGDLPGNHVWRWNKPVWGLLALGSLVLFSVSLLALVTPAVFLAVGLAGAAGLAVLFAIRLPGAAR